ncbi:MAG: YHS domain-containing (seleno)protein, partial [Pseudomonadota bacterium]
MMRVFLAGLVLILLAEFGTTSLDVALADAETSEATEADILNSWYGQQFALDGQDVVSFRSEEGPVDGSDEYAVEWDDTTWKFSSENNRDAFLEDPERYMPEFGGYCPVALASGDVKIGSARHFTIVDD